jgi:hypothetical protein
MVQLTPEQVCSVIDFDKIAREAHATPSIP